MLNTSTFNSIKFNQSSIGVAETRSRKTRFYKKRFELLFDIKAKKATQFNVEWLIKAIKMIRIKEEVQLYAKRKLKTDKRFTCLGIKHINFLSLVNLLARKQFSYVTNVNINAKRSVKLHLQRELLKTRWQKFEEDYKLKAKKTHEFKNAYNLSAIKQIETKNAYNINAEKDITNILEALDLID